MELKLLREEACLVTFIIDNWTFIHRKKLICKQLVKDDNIKPIATINPTRRHLDRSHYLRIWIRQRPVLMVHQHRYH